MWCPTIYFLRYHGAVWGVWGCLSFRTVNQLQWSILLICFYAHNNDVILHKGYCINDQSACVLHTLTTFSTWNKFWILSRHCCTWIAELQKWSMYLVYVKDEFFKSRNNSSFWSVFMGARPFIPQSICGNSVMDLQDSLQFSSVRRCVVVEWTEPQPPEIAVPFPLPICFQHSCLQMLKMVALSSTRAMPEYKQDQTPPVKQ